MICVMWTAHACTVPFCRRQTAGSVQPLKPHSHDAHWSGLAGAGRGSGSGRAGAGACAGRVGAGRGVVEGSAARALLPGLRSALIVGIASARFIPGGSSWRGEGARSGLIGRGSCRTVWRLGFGAALAACSVRRTLCSSGERNLCRHFRHVVEDCRASDCHSALHFGFGHVTRTDSMSSGYMGN